MKLKDLKPGDFFQFSRQSNPEIHCAVNGPAGGYRTAGDYYEGYPRQRCFRGDVCPHGHKQDQAGQSSPERGVKKRDIDGIIKRLKVTPWSNDGEAVCEHLVQLGVWDRALTKVREAPELSYAARRMLFQRTVRPHGGSQWALAVRLSRQGLLRYDPVNTRFHSTNVGLAAANAKGKKKSKIAT